MNREIKFRAWLKNEEENGGTMYYNCLPLGGWDKWWVSMDQIRPDAFDGEFEVDKDIFVMQYTGLKDCKGNDIYEGDLLGSKRYVIDGEEMVIVPVEFRDGAFGWIGDVTKRHWPFCKEPLDDYEVVGNIFEHPHLLTSHPWH